ncbi:MAG: aspartyl/asparaginyl beta-hydroxylase domain-containing protein [Gammaproteobacteria bacterium]|nr:aspartyl/asparaginyl beta-hydroxylase domain-containing protein [Gammaproteobacteria bacterium]
MENQQEMNSELLPELHPELNPIRELLQNQKAKQAESDLKSILKAEPDNVPALRLLAVAYKNQKKLDKFLKTLKKTYECSQDISDFELYVFELLKSKAFSEATVLKQKAMTSPDYKNQLLKLIRDENVIAVNNHNFYLSYTLNEIKKLLDNQAAKLGPLSDEQKARIRWFNDNLFNTKAYQSELKSFLHRPSYIFYPGLEQAPYTELESVIKVDNYQDALESIRKEALKLLNSNEVEPYISQTATPPKELLGLKGSLNWSSLTILEGGQLKLAEGNALVDLVNDLFDVADCKPLAPEMMLSVLQPGTHIAPHHGLTNLKQTLHIPITIPEGNVKIKVCGMEKEWQLDKPLVFDDSFLHEAWNKSNEARVVLIVDIWHPDLTEQERVFLSMAMPVLDQWHKATQL